MDSFDLLNTTRQNIISTVSTLTLDQVNKVPKGFANNIAWQLGHVLVTQQLLVYRLSGQPAKVSDELIDKYRKGTEASGKINAEELDSIKSSLLSLVSETQKDYQSGIFTSFKEYQTSYNATLCSVDDAIEFNNLHEALHLGSIMALRKLVTKTK